MKTIRQPEFKFGLLETVRDKLTGFQGIISARTEWAYGCRRYSVQPRVDKMGKPQEAMGFDEMALVRIRRAPKGTVIQKEKGGTHREPTRAPHTTPRYS